MAAIVDAIERHARARAESDRFARPGEAIAALDLGTNNCRLLVARAGGPDGFAVIDSFSRIVRLGEGVAARGRLSDRAMARTLAALRVCAQILARHRVTRVRCVATEACRKADNGHAFLARIARNTGLRFEILGQDEEARLALLGCVGLLDRDAEHLLMVDIGGGSTEMIWLSGPGRPSSIVTTASLPLGVVELAETHGPEPDAASYEAMVAKVGDHLAHIEARHGIASKLAHNHAQMLGTSGTVTTLAALHLGLRHYDRRRVDGQRMPFSAVVEVAGRLRAMSHASRAAHACIGPGRADLVVAGCAILEAIGRLWPIEELSVADRGVREGILTTLVGRSLEQMLLEDVPS